MVAGTNSYLSMCWLKASGGGWTTSTRMHEAVALPCIFCCEDCIDEFGHYLICLISDQLAREVLSLGEAHFAVGHRLCLTEYNHNRLKLLGYCHLLYHPFRKDT